MCTIVILYREFFANRAAAQLIKARVEQYERVGGSYAEGGHIGGQQEDLQLPGAPGPRR